MTIIEAVRNSSLRMVPEPGRYRHFKGAEYELLGVAEHTENGELVAVYRPADADGPVWVRPLEMFLEGVERERGVEVPRFRRVA
jgi:hypothetical protein